MTIYPFMQVDAFAERPLSGNLNEVRTRLWVMQAFIEQWQADLDASLRQFAHLATRLEEVDFIHGLNNRRRILRGIGFRQTIRNVEHCLSGKIEGTVPTAGIGLFYPQSKKSDTQYRSCRCQTGCWKNTYFFNGNRDQGVPCWWDKGALQGWNVGWIQYVDELIFPSLPGQRSFTQSFGGAFTSLS